MELNIANFEATRKTFSDNDSAAQFVMTMFPIIKTKLYKSWFLEGSIDTCKLIPRHTTLALRADNSTGDNYWVGVFYTMPTGKEKLIGYLHTALTPRIFDLDDWTCISEAPFDEEDVSARNIGMKILLINKKAMEKVEELESA